MENTNESTGKEVTLGVRIDNDLRTALENLAAKEKRTVSNTVRWILLESPLVQENLASEPSAAAA